MLKIDRGTICRAKPQVPGPVGLEARSCTQLPPPGPLPPAPEPSEPNLEEQARQLISSLFDYHGKPAKVTDADLFKAAADLEVDVALVRAFAEVESGGAGFVKGRLKIAYEGHIFRALTKSKYDRDYPELSCLYRDQRCHYHDSRQEEAWKALKDAGTLDPIVALQSCSWGRWQIMGFNYELCGYNDVVQFVKAMNEGENRQLDALVAFCRNTKGLLKAMQDKNFEEMAILYNGPDKAQEYAPKLKNAYNKYKVQGRQRLLSG